MRKKLGWFLLASLPVLFIGMYLVLVHRNRATGITRDEAERIAKAYFTQNTGCGFYEGVQDAGNHWDVYCRFGFSGTPWKFQIDKKNGQIVDENSPRHLKKATKQAQPGAAADPASTGPGR